METTQNTKTSKVKTLNIGCFGEILWDVFPDKKKLGGAPYNVAAHLVQHGNKAFIISAVGKDQKGDEIIREVERKGVKNFIHLDPTHDTGVVLVSLDEKGNASYEIKENVAWDYIPLQKEIISAVKNSDAFVFGSLACRSSKSRDSLLNLLAHATLSICDLNIRQKYYSKELIHKLLQHADILKINDDEAFLLQDIFDVKPEDFYKVLQSNYSLSMIIKTKGDKGAEACYQDRIYKHPGYKVKVTDTVGSGDSFLASFIHHYLKGNAIDLCLDKACRIGSYVASHHGAIPNYNNSIYQ